MNSLSSVVQLFKTKDVGKFTKQSTLIANKYLFKSCVEEYFPPFR